MEGATLLSTTGPRPSEANREREMMMRTVLCYGDSNTHGTKPLHMLGQRERYPAEVRWPRRLAWASSQPPVH